jgi:hypothetical protein
VRRVIRADIEISTSLRDQLNTLSQKLRNILMVPGLPTLHAQRHRHCTHHNRRVHVWPKLHTTFSARSQETKSGAFRAMRNNAYRLHILSQILPQKGTKSTN